MDDHSNRTTQQCLPPGLIMALVDEQLQGREKAEASLHLQRCPRCQQAADDFRAVARVVEEQAYCLDDEEIAIYVDHHLGRMRGPVSRSELDRIRGHLKRCAGCRQAMEITAAACRPRIRILDRARRLIGRDGTTTRPLPPPAVRWAWAAVLAVAALALWLAVGRWEPRQRPAPRKNLVARAPTAPRPVGRTGPALSQPAMPRGATEPRTGGAKQLAAPRRETQQPEAAGGGGAGHEHVPPATGEGLVTPQLPPDRETALMSPKERADAAVARALADLQRARAAGDSKEQAKVAFRLAGLYHRQAQHALAAEHYREAAAAAEKSGEAELRVDATILLGSALAEQREATSARQQFDLALKLARETGYQKGERNALVQLQLLDSEAAGAGANRPARESR